MTSAFPLLIQAIKTVTSKYLTTSNLLVQYRNLFRTKLN